MKEGIFIRKNKEKWQHYEECLHSFKGSMSAEELATSYQEVLSDLAYAQTQFPNSRIVYYLNTMSKELHEKVYAPRVNTFQHFMRMLTEEIPGIVARARFELLLSLVLFSAFVLAGVIFSVRDEGYITEVLGERYVEMTLQNIAAGKPTDVYSGGSMLGSFLSIMENNLWVTFKMYGCGVLPFIGPLLFIKPNGLMLGCFQSLFFLHGVGFQSMTAIWIHGAFEISSLVIAAGAAFRLSRGWVFPGTYPRAVAFRRTGMESIKILASVVPLFIVAAFFEGFITRQVQYPLIVKLLLIFGSFSFIIFYYVVMPYRYYRKYIKMPQK